MTPDKILQYCLNNLEGTVLVNLLLKKKTARMIKALILIEKTYTV